MAAALVQAAGSGAGAGRVPAAPAPTATAPTPRRHLRHPSDAGFPLRPGEPEDARADSPGPPPGLHVVACSRQHGAHGAPSAAECAHCEAWRRRCAGLEASLHSAEARAARSARRPSAVTRTKTELATANSAEAEVQVGPVANAERSCQTQGPTAPPTDERGSQAGTSLCFLEEAFVQTEAPAKPEVQYVRPSRGRARGTQTEILMAGRDVGCMALLDDEAHCQQRRELLAKIDVLMAEADRLRAESADAQKENRQLRLHMEADRPLLGVVLFKNLYRYAWQGGRDCIFQSGQAYWE